MTWLALLQKDPKARQIELIQCRDDPWYWLTHWVHTIDTNDAASPEKLFPNKEHLFIITKYWQMFPTLLMPKSRQMTATWICCGLYLHNAFFFPHRLTFFQSKKEEDAAELVTRTKQMYDSLPWWMHEWNGAEFITAHVNFKRSKSRIIGIPSGPEHIRGYNPSGVFSDEVVYQPQIDEVVRTIRPAIRGGGRLTMTSSTGPSYFQHMCLDTL